MANRRKIFVKGLGSLEVRQIDPSVDARFTSVGFLKGTTLNDVYTMVAIPDEQGNAIDYLPSAQAVSIDSELLQTGLDQLSILKNAPTQEHAVRYFGQEGATSFKWIAAEIARINPSISQKYQVGLRTLPIMIKVLSQQELAFPIPAYYLIETNGNMGLDGLCIWADVRQGLNADSQYLLDASGFARHGTISSAFASLWKTGDGLTTFPLNYLQLGGTADDIDFGDVLDIDASSDFAFEVWLRVQGADASQQEVYGKKSDDTATAGHRLIRTSGNKMEFKMADGTNAATVITSGSVLQNVWKLVQFSGSRAGNGQFYLNGVADGSAVSLAGVTGSCGNALHFILGLFNGAYGQVDIGSLRWFDYAAGKLPADIATRFSNHFAAERAFYGV